MALGIFAKWQSLRCRHFSKLLYLTCLFYRFYEALIEDVNDDHLKVKFDGYTTLETVSLSEIKKIGSAVKRPLSGDESKLVFYYTSKAVSTAPVF